MHGFTVVAFNWVACLLNILLCIINYRRYCRLRALTPRISTLKCPNCSGESWLTGPSGGLSTNIECVNCGDRYNHTPFGLDWIGHRSEDQRQASATAPQLPMQQRRIKI